MGEAAKISLKAIGKQDTHLLSKDPEDSLFHPKIEQHSEFRKYHNRHTVSNPSNKSWWPFGETIKVDLKPQNMGDLLTNMWVRIDLPIWNTDLTWDDDTERYYFLNMTAAELGVLLTGSAYTPQEAYTRIRNGGNPFNPSLEPILYNGFNAKYNYFRFRSQRWLSFLRSEMVVDGIAAGGARLPEADYWGYAQYVGRKLIKKIRIIVDENVLEELDADSIVIYDNIYKTRDQKIGANLQYNMGVTSFTLETLTHQEQRYAASNQMFVHVPFFFSRNYRKELHENNIQHKQSFPICAIHKQKIQVEIEFFDTPYFIQFYEKTTLDSNVLPTKTISNFDILTEEITLNDEERLYYKNNSLLQTYDFMNRHSSTDVKPNENRFISVQLEPNIPVKMLHWFFRWNGYEELGNYEKSLITNRFNYSEYPGGNHVLKNAHFTLNGERLPRVSDIDYRYFLEYINTTLKLSESGVNPDPDVNNGVANNYDETYIYSYGFAIHPKSTQMSGFLDFSDLNSEQTKLHIELGDEVVDANNDYTLYMYYTGYRTLKFENGYVSFVI